ncbi:hypothetical protein PFMC_04962, partial [Plasmodium falciparum CAMP/Malaysia]
MKIHYINILLFELPLNILINDQRNHKNTTHHTPKISTTRLLCECDIYTSIYDNDQEMKEVMQQFEVRTSQRFHEYDDRMKTTRQKCKDKCHKEIEKIILKDKLEKQMAQQLTTLETKIDTDDIPTCICEKSMVDKMEKGCLRCGGVLGGGIAPTFGLIGSVAINMWKTTEIAAAMELAKQAGAAAGLKAGNAHGMNVVIGSLKRYFFIEELGINSLDSFFTTKYYFNIEKLAKAIYDQRNAMCGLKPQLSNEMCDKIATKLGLILRGNGRAPPGKGPIVQGLNGLAEKAKLSADDVTKTISEK